ncbi:MAG: AMP-binding protein [Saprospiraceae bacterium]
MIQISTPTVVDFVNDCCKKYSNQEVFYCMGKSITYKEFDQLSTQFGAYLQSRGLKPRDRIAIMMPNLLQYPIAMMGALKAGLIIVNTNPLYTAREMQYQFNDSEVNAIIIIENFAANLETILPQTKIKTIILTSIGELLGTVKGTLINFVVRKIKRMVPKYNLPNIVSFTHALSEGKKFSIQPFENTYDDVIIHQYTGGTTGISKGAMLTNRNIVANVIQIKEWMKPFLIEGKEIVLSPLPLYHIFAFTVNGLSMLGYGAKTILVTNARDIPSIVKEFKQHKITLMTGLNTLFNALLNNSNFKDIDFSSLKVVVGGGMAVQKAVAERWLSTTGCRLTEGYGMTEASPLITVNPLDDKAKSKSIGLPVSSTDVRIMMENGNIANVGEIGEIQCKGPQVMKGYYNRLEETLKTITTDGWLCTGDIGMMDADGYFYIVDRKKDMILVSGFNVYPNEIEDVVMTHPKVLEVAAIGVPDEKSGEAPKLFVVKKDQSLTEDEILQHCRQNLTGYKCPKYVEFRDELPKTNVGKILRRALKS